MCQLEGDRQLRRNFYLLVAGGRRTYRTGASADQTADQYALASARESADQHASASSTSDHLRGALALTLHDPCIGRSLDSHRRSADVDGGQGDRQYTLTLEFARRFYIDNSSTHARSGRDRNYPVHYDRTRPRTRKRVARIRCFR